MAAANEGADAIGMVFHTAAPRCVTMDQARQIAACLPPMISTVGLFVNASAEEIRRVMAEISLTTVQLHGDETPEFVAQLKPTPVIKAIRVDDQLTQTLQKWRRAIVELDLTNLTGFVMETANAGAPGGTGVANDWKAIETLKQIGAFEGLPCLIAAGGLTPMNVAAVVQSIRPFAVDVSSGVESAKREKSIAKIEAFMRAVHTADQSLGE